VEERLRQRDGVARDKALLLSAHRQNRDLADRGGVISRRTGRDGDDGMAGRAMSGAEMIRKGAATSAMPMMDSHSRLSVAYG
jgi:hypothetical protein